MVLFLSVPLFCQAQDMKSVALIKDFEQHFAHLDSIIFHRGANANCNMADTSGICNMQIDLNTITPTDVALINQTNARIKDFKAQTGLQLSGQTYYHGGEEWNEDDAVSRYTGKLQAELGWNYFNSRFFKSKPHIKAIKTEQQIEDQLIDRETKNDKVNEHKQTLRLIYDDAQHYVLSLHIKNLQMLKTTQKYLLSSGKITSDDLLFMMNELAQCERKYAVSERRLLHDDSNKALTEQILAQPGGIIVTIDTAQLFTFLKQEHYDMRLFNLRNDLIKQKKDMVSYWNSSNIQPFVRVSHYMRQDRANSTNLDAGVSFKLNLSNASKHQRQSFNAEQALNEAQKEVTWKRIADNVLLIVEDINRINTAIIGESYRLKELEDYIAMRINAYKNSTHGYDMLTRAKEYNNYFSCWENLLSFHYQRDCLIADLQVYIPDIPVQMFCHTRQIGLDQRLNNLSK